MSNINVVLDTTDVVKLLTICSATIAAEKESLRGAYSLRYYNNDVVKLTARSIAKIREIEHKLLSAAAQNKRIR